MKKITIIKSNIKLDRAAKEKESARKIISVEIRQNNAEVKRLKHELQQRGIAVKMWQELNAWAALITTIVEEKQCIERRIQETFKEAQETFKQTK